MKKRAGLARAMALDPDILLGRRAERRASTPITSGEIDAAAGRSEEEGRDASSSSRTTSRAPATSATSSRCCTKGASDRARAARRSSIEATDEMVRAFMRSEGSG